MQAQEVPPYADGTSPGAVDGDHGHKKKSVIGKVKDKAKKFKSKIKSPKTPSGAGDNNSSSSASSNEEDSGNEPHQQAGGERGIAITPGLKGEAHEAVPGDPHTDTAGIGEKFGQLNLADESNAAVQDRGVPSAIGIKDTPTKTADEPDPIVEHGKAPSALDQASFDKPEHGTERGYDVPAGGGRNVEGDDSIDKPAGSAQDVKKNHVVEGAAAAAAASAAGLGLKSHDDKEHVEETGRDSNEAPGESQPSVTSRAADTFAGLKDTAASKMGYASNPTDGADTPSDTTAFGHHDAQATDNKSVLQTVQDKAAGASAVAADKLGYGGNTQSPSDETGGHEEVAERGESKPYTQQVKEAAFGAKDAVAAQLGYGGAATEGNTASGTGEKSYMEKAQDLATGAKDTVASNLGYAPTGDQNVGYGSPGSRFHPGEEDKALSQLITEKMSTGAATARDTIMRPFSGATQPTPPSSAVAPERDAAVAPERDAADP